MKDAVILFVIYLLRVIMRVLYIFPIRDNRILFCSYKGEEYSCNPKYIAEYMRNNNDIKWEEIWAYKDRECIKCFPEDVKKCKYHGLMYFYYLATSKIAVDNVGFISAFPRRDKQMFINTWHGGGCYKNVGIEEKKISEAYRKREILSADNTSVYLSSSRYFSQNVARRQLAYRGNILEVGMPRNDIFFEMSDEYKTLIKEKIRRYYNIDKDVKMLLYAPTWRYSSSDEIYNIDFERVVEELRERFGGNWSVLYRMHHYLRKNDEHRVTSIISADDYPDMQELLVAADILISDYSACIWDYSFTYKPCFLYATDLEEYKKERGFGKDIYSWGFPVCCGMDELIEKIRTYDENEYIKKIEEHHRELGNVENGYARKYIMDYILSGQTIQKVDNY